jgi:hypothetical protein
MLLMSCHQPNIGDRDVSAAQLFIFFSRLCTAARRSISGLWYGGTGLAAPDGQLLAREPLLPVKLLLVLWVKQL